MTTRTAIVEALKQLDNNFSHVESRTLSAAGAIAMYRAIRRGLVDDVPESNLDLVAATLAAGVLAQRD